MMKPGDRIQCWTEQEMIHKEYDLVRKGIWTERVKDRANCLVVISVREEEEDE